MTAAVQEEMSLRRQAASLVQVTLVVMNAAHISIPALRWYIHQLAAAQPKAVQFKVKAICECAQFSYASCVLTELYPCTCEDGILLYGVLCSC